MSIKDFQVMAKLGEGAYSSVYKVKRLIDQSVYALKKVKLFHLSNAQIHNAVNEVRILASIRHPNIIGYKEAFYDQPSKSLCIIMEYADGGDLLQKIFEYKRRGLHFEEHYIWNIFTQILKGLSVLHEFKILHRDIKSANVFLTKGGLAKLGDMNVSKVVRKDKMCETQTGTPYYASPEVWKDEPYDVKSDIWSLGCVLYEFITLKPPFRGRDMESLFKKVTRGYYSRIGKNFTTDLSDVLKSLIRVTPSERYSCKQLLGLPIVKKKLSNKNQEVQEESVLLKTIKLTKNINYLTQKLPKPNYSPLKFRSLMKNKSELDKLYKNPQLHLSLPPIKRNLQAVQSDRSIVKKPRVKRQGSLPRLVLRNYEPIRKLY